MRLVTRLRTSYGVILLPLYICLAWLLAADTLAEGSDPVTAISGRLYLLMMLGGPCALAAALELRRLEAASVLERKHRRSTFRIVAPGLFLALLPLELIAPALLLRPSLGATGWKLWGIGALWIAGCCLFGACLGSLLPTALATPWPSWHPYWLWHMPPHASPRGSVISLGTTTDCFQGSNSTRWCYKQA